MAFDRETARLAAMIASPVWTDQYAQRVRETAAQMNETLKDCAAGNAAHPALACAYAAGFIRALEWVLRWPEEVVAEATIKAQEEKIVAERQMEYETRARNGYTYPFVETTDARAE